MIWYWILLIFGGFLLGSVMFCQIIPKVFLHKDIYEISEDHNSGTFNVYKYCGMKVAIPCLILDMLKGFVPVLIASLLMDTDNVAFSLVLVAPVLGHAVGLFNKFHGGKCVATSFGVTLGLIPVAWIAFAVQLTLFILLSTLIKVKPRNARCVAVYVLFAVIVCTTLGVLGQGYVALGCGLVALLPILKFAVLKRNFTAETSSVAASSVAENNPEINSAEENIIGANDPEK